MKKLLVTGGIWNRKILNISTDEVYGELKE